MHVLLKNYLLYFFGILLIIWLSESLIHSFIQLFGYLFDFKKTNFFISLFPRLWILQKDRLGVPDHLIHAKNAHVPEWQRQWLLLGRKSRPFLSSIRKQFIAFVPQGISIKNDLPESLTVPDLISMKTLERICAWHRWRAANPRICIGYSYLIVENEIVNWAVIGRFFQSISWSERVIYRDRT